MGPGSNHLFYYWNNNENKQQGGPVLLNETIRSCFNSFVLPATTNLCMMSMRNKKFLAKTLSVPVEVACFLANQKKLANKFHKYFMHKSEV